MTSGVSALWGFVANGHRAVRHVSSDLSKIPYGGFSPVRLQTGNVRRHLHRLRRLIGGLKRRRPPDLGLPALSRGEGREARRISVQRPLARRRVVLSRRVNAYYGLIRAPDALRRAYAFRTPVFASRPRARRSLLSSANPSVRAAFRTPADRAAQDDCTSARDSLRPNARGSASAVTPLESVHVGCPNEAAKFA